MKNTYLVLLGADQFLRERAVAAALRSFEGELVTIVKDPCLNRNRFFHYSLQGDPMDASTSLSAIENFLKINPGKVVGVVHCIDWTLLSAAKISPTLNLPSLSVDVVDFCRDKLKMKKKFAEFDLPVPRFALFRTFEELKSVSN